MWGVYCTVNAFEAAVVMTLRSLRVVVVLAHEKQKKKSYRTGKEAIATVGVRIGRTCAHMALYLCSSLVGGAPPQRALMGVALAAAAAWAVALRNVEVLAKKTGGEYRRAPSSPPPPSKQQACAAEGTGALPWQREVDSASLGVAGSGGGGSGGVSSRTRSRSSGKGAGAGARARGGLRRRGARAEELENGSPATNGSHAAAQTNGHSAARKEL